MDQLLQDVRFAARSFSRRPAFVAGVVFILALGIGTATAMFTVVNSVVLKPLPYADAGRVVMIWSSWADFPRTWVSYDEYEAWQTDVDAFEEAAIAYSPLVLTVGGADDPESVPGAAVSESLLRVLGVQPVAGRGFLPAEDVPGGEEVALLGHDLWQRRFAGDPGIVGALIDIDDRPTRIVGILPSRFRMPMDYGTDNVTEILRPLAAEPADYGAIPGDAVSPGGGAHTFFGFARLADGATVEDANTELDAVVQRMSAAGVYPPSWNFDARVVSMSEQVTGELHPALWGLGASVMLVLLIACANVAGLMLIRAELRSREFGVRSALGANRGVLARQVLAETGLIAILAGAAGIAMAWVAIRGLRLVAPASLPRFGEVGIEGLSLGFAFAVTALCTFLVGLVPAAQAARARPGTALGRMDTSGPGSARRFNSRFALIVTEVALAVVLVAGAGLMVRTVTELTTIDPGFESEGVATIELALASSRYPTPESVAAFYRELQARVETLPAVKSVGAVRILPLASEIGDRGVTVDSYQPAPGEIPAGEWQVVTPGYFQLMNIDLLHGRYFQPSDDETDPAIVINQAFANKYFAGLQPVGRTVSVGGTGTAARVVGVVADTRHNDLTSAVKPRVYLPHAVFAQRTMHLLVRSEADPQLLAGSIRDELRALDPRLAAGEIRMMSDIVADATAQPRFVMLTLAGFGLVALVLGLAGIHAVLGYFVSQRTREIGIRMSLGAERKSIFRNVLQQGLALIAIGVVAGCAAALLATQLLQSLLVGVSPADPVTYVVTALLFLVAGGLACLQPALRAVSVSPVEALRDE